MNNYQKLAFVLGLSSLAGCSYIYSEEGLIKDRTFEYLDAKQEKELQIPQGLTQKNKVNYAQVPAIGNTAKNAPYGRDLRVNAPIQILAVLENMRLDKTSEQPAVYIADDFDFLWSNILSIFEEREIQLEKVSKNERFIDTGWMAQDVDGIWLGLENSEEIDDFRSRFEIRITKGDLNNEYRIETKRIGAELLDESDKWTSVPTFWHDSAEMLNLIISQYDQKVAERDIAKRNRVIAGFKVELSKDAEGNAALVTDADKEDVWTKLPDVLVDMNFEVNDRDRQLMTYFTELLAPETGFFASLFTEEKEPLVLEPGNYQIVVSTIGERTAITFKDDQGTPLDNATVAKFFPQVSARFGEKQ